jgi:hypothetical protein
VQQTEAPPRDLLIVDRIEFNDRLRFSDPVADMGFLYMDLRSRLDRTDLPGVPPSCTRSRPAGCGRPLWVGL